MWRQGKIYTPLAMLLKLRRVKYTGSRSPRAISGNTIVGQSEHI